MANLIPNTFDVSPDKQINHPITNSANGELPTAKIKSPSIKKQFEDLRKSSNSCKKMEQIKDELLGYTSLEEQEFIKKYSLFNKEWIKGADRLPISPNLFAAIHGHNLTLNSQFDGGDPKSSLLFLTNLLEILAPHDFIELDEAKLENIKDIQRFQCREYIWIRDNIKGIIDSAQNACLERADDQTFYIHSLQKLIEEIIFKIIDLKEGKSLLIPGGWSGHGGQTGHAMTYEVAKDINGSYTFSIHNTGNGSEYHLNAFYGYKGKILGSLQYANLTLQDINSTTFKKGLQGLLECQILPIILKYKLDKDHIYQIANVMCLSIHAATIKAQPAQQLMSPQRAGNCFYYVFKIGLKNLFGHQDYKRFKHFIKLSSLLSFYTNCKGSLSTNRDYRILLQESAEKLARSTLKLWHTEHNPPIISLEEACSAYATSQALLNELNTSEKETDSFQPLAIQDLEQAPIDHPLLGAYLANLCTQYKNSSNGVQNSCLPILKFTKEFKASNPNKEQILEYVQLLNQKTDEANSNHDYFYTINTIQEFCKSVPTPNATVDNIWSELEENNLSPVLKEVMHTMQNYFEGMSGCASSNATLEDMTVMYKLLAVVDTLSHQIFKTRHKKLYQKALDFRFPLIDQVFFKSHTQSPYAYSYEPEFAIALKDLSLYWQSEDNTTTSDPKNIIELGLKLDQRGKACFFGIVETIALLLSPEERKQLHSLVDERLQTEQKAASSNPMYQPVPRKEFENYFLTADLGQYQVLPLELIELKKAHLMVQQLIYNSIPSKIGPLESEVQDVFDNENGKGKLLNTYFSFKEGPRISVQAEKAGLHNSESLIHRMGLDLKPYHGLVYQRIPRKSESTELSLSDILEKQQGSLAQIIKDHHSNRANCLIVKTNSEDTQELRISDIILLYQSQLKYFEDREMQKLFVATLFGNQGYLFKELYDSPELAKRLIELIQDGITYFSQKQKLIHLEPVLFLCDVNRQLNAYLRKLSEQNPVYLKMVNELSTFLKDLLKYCLSNQKGLKSNTDQFVIRLQRLLVNLEKSSLTQEKLQEIIEDHFYIRSQHGSDDSFSHIRIQLDLLLRKKFDILKASLTESQCIHSILNQSLEVLDLPSSLTKSKSWEGNFPNYMNEHGTSVNLLMGSIIFKGGVFTEVPSAWIWSLSEFNEIQEKQKANYSYPFLFGTEVFKGFLQDNVYIIENHPLYGTLRLGFSPGSNAPSFVEKVIDGQRYVYVLPLKLHNIVNRYNPSEDRNKQDTQQNILELLSKPDLTTWLAVDDKTLPSTDDTEKPDLTSSIEMLFIDWKEQRVKYKVNLIANSLQKDPLAFPLFYQSGHANIVELDDNGQVVRRLAYLDKNAPFYKEQLTPLSQIHDPSTILIWKDEKGEKIESVILPSCLDEGGKPLEFIPYTSEKFGMLLLWKKFPEFYITKINQDFGIKDFTDGLLLQNKEGQQKVLIPFRQYSDPDIQQTLNLSRKGLKLPTGETSLYIICDVNDKKSLVAHSTQAKLFLSYLCLAKRDYQQALYHIKTLTVENEFTEADKKFFYIFFGSKIIFDYNPNNSALLMLLQQIQSSWTTDDQNAVVTKEKEKFVEQMGAASGNYYEKESSVDSRIKPLLGGSELKENLTLSIPKRFSNQINANNGVLELHYPIDWYSVELNLHLNISDLVKPIRLDEHGYWVNNPEIYFAKNFGYFYQKASENCFDNEFLLLLSTAPNTGSYNWQDLNGKLSAYLRYALAVGYTAPRLPKEPHNYKAFFNQLHNKAQDYFKANPAAFHNLSISSKEPTILDVESVIQKVFHKSQLKSDLTIAPVQNVQHQYNILQGLIKNDLSLTEQKLKQFPFTAPLALLGTNYFKTTTVALEEVPRNTPSFNIDDSIDPEPIIEKEFSDFQIDYLTGSKVAAVPAIQLGLSLKEIAISLREQKTQDDLTIAILKNQICSLLNSSPLAPVEKLNYHLKQTGKMQEKFVIDNAEFFFIQPNDHLLKQKTYLTQEQIILFYHKMTHYLLLKTRSQQITRLLRTLNELKQLEKSTIANVQQMSMEHQSLEQSQALIDQAYQETYTRRYYKLDPTCYISRLKLLLEAKADVLLREKQVQVISKMLNKTASGNYEDLVVQLMMGQGKTKVILPLLAQARADGDCLPIIVVPDALYHVTKRDLHKISTQTFGQAARYIDERKTCPLTREGLLHTDTVIYLKDLLEEVRSKRQYLVTTPEVLQNIELSYVEALSRQNESHVQLLAEILTILRTKGSAIIDEVDTILNCRRELHYTTGNGLTIPEKQQELVLHLYHTLLSVKTECQVPEISKELYHKIYLPILIDSLKTYSDLNLSEDELKLFKAIISNVSHDSNLKDQWESWIQQLIKQNKERANLIILAKEELTHFLPYTLGQYADVKYGFSKISSCPYAIPYYDNNRPNEKAEFANEFECMNYTVQLYLKKGLSTKQAIQVLQDHLQLAEKQSKVNLEPFADTEAVKNFHYKYGLNLCDLDPSNFQDVEVVRDKISNDSTLLFDYIKNYVLNQIKTYPDKISHYSANFVDILASVQGVTGTPWNYTTFHQRFTPSLDVGTEGRIAYELIEIKNNPAVLKIENTTPKAFLQELQKYQRDYFKKLHAIMDVGAMFKGIANSEVALAMAQFFHDYYPSIKGVLYFDLALKQLRIITTPNFKTVELQGSDFRSIKDKGFTPDILFTYYDQANCTGTDILQSSNATAIMTIDEHSFRRDFFQGAFRMRKLLASQNVQIAVTTDVYNKICDNLDLKEELHTKEIIQFTLKNQAQRLGEDNYRALIQKIDNLIRQQVLEILLKEDNSSLEQIKLFEQGLNQLLTHVQETELCDLYRGITSYADPFALLSGSANSIKEKSLQKLEQALRQCQLAEPRIDKICSSLSKEIDSTLIGPAHAHKHLLRQVPAKGAQNTFHDVQVERTVLSTQQTNNQNTVEQNTQSELELYQISSVQGNQQPYQSIDWWTNFDVYTHTISEVRAIKELNSSVVFPLYRKQFKLGAYGIDTIYSKYIKVSKNLLHTYGDSDQESSNSDLFSDATKPIQYCLYRVHKQTHALEIVLLEQREALEMRKKLLEKVQNSDVLYHTAILDITGQAYYISDQTQLQQIQSHQNFDSAVMQIMHFAGAVSYLTNKNCYDKFINWLREEPDIEFQKIVILKLQSSFSPFEYEKFKLFYESYRKTYLENLDLDTLAQELVTLVSSRVPYKTELFIKKHLYENRITNILNYLPEPSKEDSVSQNVVHITVNKINSKSISLYRGVKILSLLVRAGANLNLREKNYSIGEDKGDTLFHKILRLEEAINELYPILLPIKRDYNLPDREGKTPLQIIEEKILELEQKLKNASQEEEMQKINDSIRTYGSLKSKLL
ncbi:MAG: hypothetical protein K0S74_419 [Chlamydiales bacterium]|jgi:hypothetical protein|nr:hypothetical protein [Chlamydiales bacterium]